ncbi:MAG: CheR family methyltransferase [Nitrospinota bacterium]
MSSIERGRKNPRFFPSAVMAMDVLRSDFSKDPAPGQKSQWNRREFLELSNYLLKERGFSISGYKPGYIARRVAIRINSTRSSTFRKYFELLKDEPEELSLLYDTLTVNVSSFFRNREVFESIKTKVFPEMVRRKRREGASTIKIWSLGCSTGEEPYSLNILLKKSLSFRLKGFDVGIFATDIDNEALLQAKKGLYGADVFTDNDSGVLRSAFRKRGDTFQIRDAFKRGITFKKQDIFELKPMQEKFDLILCRNVLIYFTKIVHRDVLGYLADHLPVHGVLVLGKAEVLLNPQDTRFEHIDLENRIYKKIRNS